MLLPPAYSGPQEVSYLSTILPNGKSIVLLSTTTSFSYRLLSLRKLYRRTL